MTTYTSNLSTVSIHYNKKLHQHFTPIKRACTQKENRFKSCLENMQENSEEKLVLTDNLMH